MLREGLAQWRRLGPVEGTRRALIVVVRILLRSLRGVWLRVRPIRPSTREVDAALGGVSPRDALRGRVLDAMPTVAAFERSLEGLDDGARSDLLRRADRVLAHEFDLLGSGPVGLGPKIDWQRDFKHGRSWPMRHVSRATISYPDGSDIKVPWELSRAQHLPLLAAAWRLTGERRYLDEIGAQLTDWIATNPVEFGTNWACTMDVAIRAANWVATLALGADAAVSEPWLGAVLSSLLAHGRFIRNHPELAEVRGNHYLADVVGLTPVAALFHGGREGREWADWSARQLVSEMEHQVHEDGVDHEASIAYHRLVTELFVCGSHAVDALTPGALPPAYRERLERMLQFTADYTRPDGMAPQIGDVDDGRYLPLGGYGAEDQRRHGHLFVQAGRAGPEPRRSASHLMGGFHAARVGDLYLMVRCGDTGMRGQGGHSHNDQLSFELAIGKEPLVVDPGAYLYTASPDDRNLFRSTAFHSTVRIGGAEQNELGEELFSLRDRSRAELLEWGVTAERAIFAGRHYGFEMLLPPVVHTRRIVLERDGLMMITDHIESADQHLIEWTFPLSPAAQVNAQEQRVEVTINQARLHVTCPTLEFRVVEGWYSPSFGRRVRAPFLRATARAGAPALVAELRLEARERA